MSVDGDSLRFQRSIIERLADPAKRLVDPDAFVTLMTSAASLVSAERDIADTFLWGGKPDLDWIDQAQENFDRAFEDAFEDA